MPASYKHLVDGIIAYIPIVPILIPAAIILKLADHITEYYTAFSQAIEVIVQLLLDL